MKKRFLALLAVLCIVCAHALAQPRVYTYGGSESETLYDMAVSDDGRIVMTGFANSSDGTLANRRNRGRSGWALCVNAQGEVLWSFCTRLGNHDSLRSPVFHADGSVTVFLQSEQNMEQEFEVIRLGMDGEVIARKTVMKTDSNARYLTLERTTAQGYVVSARAADLTMLDCAVFGWDAERIGDAEPESGANLHSERHDIRIEEDAGYLYARDAQGNGTRLAHVISIAQDGFMHERYNALVSLPDGGAAAFGWINGGETQKGLLTRWDAQGRRVFEWWMDGDVPLDMVKTEKGFAAVCQAVGGDESNLDYEGNLLFFDEDGICTGEVFIGRIAHTGKESSLATLPDGSLAVLSNFWTGAPGLTGQARLTIVPKEDIQ